MDTLAAPLEAPELDEIAGPAFLCRADASVVAANGPAGALLASFARAPFRHPAGELLACLNALDAGCGRGPRCARCPIRAAIRWAAAGEPVPRVPVAMELVRDGVPRRVELWVEAQPALVGGEHLAILTLLPAGWVA